MIRDIVTLAVLAVGGWFAWNELYRRGLVASAPPAIFDGPGALLKARPASGDVDRIADTVGRAIAYARQAGVPASDVPLVAGIIQVESAANPMAHNTDGEDSRGLMQIQLATAHGLHENGAITGYAKDKLGQLLFDPVINVKIGLALLRYLRGKVPKDWSASPERTTEWVLRAYNGGATWLSKGTGVRAATMKYAQRVLDASGVARARIDGEGG
ncbi:transglycosylase SLT domain-containing protein [Tateyamaria sp.]|uniref:transglycosylase SLT domain-containing protein n=1 Tax=Tateyamaria sp. TaxID=1929288 RepID=UPI003B20F9F3